MTTQNWKDITRKSYDIHAADYASFAASHRGKLAHSLDQFANRFDKGAKILDVGCGHGRDAAVLSKKGLSVTGIDFSKELLRIAQERVPDATFIFMDFEDLSFLKESFNGVFASASLLHAPRTRLLPVFEKINAVLKKNGLFLAVFREGEGEKITEEKRGNATLKRFYAYYKPEELMDLLAKAKFRESSYERDVIETGNWIFISGRK